MSGPGSPADGAATGVVVRTYRLLLRAYPAAFRAAYGREVEQLFRDQWRDRQRATAPGGAHAGFWAAVLWDVVRSAPALRWAALHAARPAARVAGRAVDARSAHTTREGTMRARRTAAALAVLGGAYEVVNTGAEVWAGYGGPTAGWALAMALSTLMGLLLLAAGVALFRGGPGATRLSRGAALACLMLVVGLQLFMPFMSVFARLLGVGLPVALLLVTRPPRGTAGRDPSVPAVA
ncbi:hypothetical protein tb265_10720 [Gemmatimonadetes bacterium T265]|nr:hypothetical protein tb265_10720 [Gemmatimonadetes bacterium T265]